MTVRRLLGLDAYEQQRTQTKATHVSNANSPPAFLKESDQLMRLSNSRITNAPHRPLRKRNTHVVSIIYWKSFSFSPPGQFQLSGGGPEITHRMRRRISPGEGRCWCYVLEADRRRRCANSHDRDARLWCFFFFFSNSRHAWNGIRHRHTNKRQRCQAEEEIKTQRVTPSLQTTAWCKIK